MQASHDEIRFLEELSLNALPALQTVVFDGWLLRSAGGHTQRANSVQTLYTASRPIGEKIEYCEKYYEAGGLPSLFKLTDASLPAGLDKELAARGYEIRTPVSVQVAGIRDARWGDSVSIRDNDPAYPPWVEAYSALTGLTGCRLSTFSRMLGNVYPAAAYATCRANKAPVALGLGVLEDGWLGLFDIVTAAEHRRQGYASAVVNALMTWGRQEGARRAYLQVTKTNTAALALYAKLGFREAYTYWYRAKPSTERDG